MEYGPDRHQHHAPAARRMSKLICLLIALPVCIGLVACSSTGMRYHTLSNHVNVDMKNSGHITSRDSDALLIEVLPVRTAEALNSSRIMIGHGDGSMTPASADQWTAPLPDELRTAISLALQQRLDAVDLYHQSDKGKARRLQISATLTKSDFNGGRRFSGIVEWEVKAIPADESIVGRTSLTLDIVEGAEGQVIAFQKLSNSVAADVAVAARAVAALLK